MIKEGSFPNANKFNEISQKKEYSEEEITEKISQGVDLDNDFAFYLLESGKQDLLIENLDKFQGLGQDIAFKLVELEKASDVIDNIDKFSNINQSGLALKLFEIGH